MGLDLAQLVHELEFVNAYTSRPVTRGQMAAVWRDPDTADPVSLVIQGVGVAGRVAVCIAVLMLAD